MCWVGTNNDELTPKVAVDNIPVEKIVKLSTAINGNGCYSAYFDKGYKMNTTYKMDKISLIGGIIEEGFHSYKGVKIKINRVFERMSIYDKNCNRKLDSWAICNKAIMSCIIPKGATYYENKYGEIVSNAIKPIYCYKVK